MKQLKDLCNSFYKYLKIFIDVTFLLIKLIFYDVLWNATISSFKTLIVVLPAYGVYVFYLVKIEDFNVDSLGIYVLTPLAILIAFSSLLYGRARAVHIEDERHFTSLVAAEKALSGAIFYSLALLWGFVITSVYLMFQLDKQSFPENLLKILYIPSILGIIFAYVELYKGLSEVWKGLKRL